jgi:hypothetical protein
MQFHRWSYVVKNRRERKIDENEGEIANDSEMHTKIAEKCRFNELEIF